MLNDILDALTTIVRETLGQIQLAYPGARVGLACNADYGQVLVAVDPAPPPSSLDVVLGDEAERFFWFGDWPITDFMDHDTAVHDLWEEKWSPHESIMLEEWWDFSPFRVSLLRKRFLEGVCQIAARMSKEFPDLDSCVLAADHDEHISQTAARLRWAYWGPPSPRHELLTRGEWYLNQQPDVSNLLAFSHDGQFINNLVPQDNAEEELETEGDWSLSESVLTMTAIETNAVENDFLWKDLAFRIHELTDRKLVYEEEDGTVWRFERRA